ncbi:MAG: orc1/cdc6 family replication initiation protein [Desulfurococcales archaeon]|nr:orc1/cdc6 family replication initiation protein [Desulfurococcales archaeon]
MSRVIDDIFEAAVKSRIFRNREKLLPDYVPDVLPHRDEEIKRLAMVLAPSLRGEKPNNVFIYGLTGTGKTAVTRLVLRKLVEKSARADSRVIPVYVNVRHRDTPYRVIADIAEGIGLRVPFTGLSVGEVYRRVVNRLNRRPGVYIVVLDEIDFLVRRHGDDLLYKLTRINEDLSRSRVSLIGITNSTTLIDNLDPRVKSSLGEEEIVFPPYNAEQLEDILRDRSRDAFYPGVLDDDVIPLCAALAAREHGDARRALDLLRVAGEIAERSGDKIVTKRHVMTARMEIEKDRVAEVVKTLPLHGKLVLAAAAIATLGGRRRATTGDVYDGYRRLVAEAQLEEVTFRRVSGIIAELDMLGILRTRTISRGRYGKTRIIELAADPQAIIGVLSNDLDLEELRGLLRERIVGKGDSLR